METQFNLDLDPAWERTLSMVQKQKLQEYIPALTDSVDSLHIICFHTNQKKNGGFVLSLLLCNHSQQRLLLDHVSVDITNRDKGVFISGEFTPNIVLQPCTVKPWSFIFKPEQTSIRNTSFKKGTITFKIRSDKNPILYHDTFSL